MKRLILGCCLLLAACNIQPPLAVDGDTINLDGDRIRIWGIDAPEFEQTCLDEGLRRYGCGKAARNALQHYLNIGTVYCYGIYRDRYDRKVAQCRVTDHDIGSLMVKSGWALDYPTYSKGHYANDEKYARERKLGIHEGPFVTPEEYRIKHQR